MDTAVLLQGLEIVVIGMGLVFLALGILMAAIKILDWVFKPSPEVEEAEAEEVPGLEARASEADMEAEVAVIAAAFQYLQTYDRSRFKVGGANLGAGLAVNISPWPIIGRQQQQNGR